MLYIDPAIYAEVYDRSQGLTSLLASQSKQGSASRYSAVSQTTPLTLTPHPQKTSPKSHKGK